jgi:hypothetical protein
MIPTFIKQTAVYGGSGVILAGLYEVLRGRQEEDDCGQNSPEKKKVELQHVKEIFSLQRHRDLLTLLAEIEDCVWKCDRVSWVRLVHGLNDLVETRILVESNPAKTSIRDRIRAFTYMKRCTDSLTRITSRLEHASCDADVRDVIRVQRIVKDITNHAQNNLSVVVFHTRDVLMSPPIHSFARDK